MSVCGSKSATSQKAIPEKVSIKNNELDHADF